MCQGIHTCGSGEAFGHGSHHFRIHNRNCRDIIGVDADELSLFLNVRDDIVDCDFRSCTGSRRYGDRRNRMVLRRSNALERTDIREFGIRNDHADCFRCIHGGTAADRNNGIRSAGLESRHAVLHVLDRRIRLDIRIYGISNSGFIEQVGHLLCDAEFDQIRIGCNKDVLIAAPLNFRDDFLYSARSMIGNVVQYDSCCHEWFLLILLYHQSASSACRS